MPAESMDPAAALATRTRPVDEPPTATEDGESGRGWRLAGLAAIVTFSAIAAADATWRSNPVFHDHWIYYGFQRNLTAHVRDFAWTYWATRLSILVPGALVHRIFGLAAGELVLHTGLLAASLLAVRAFGRRFFGERAGALAVILAGTHFFFLQGMASDYSDGYGICYQLLTGAAVLRALEPGRGRHLAAVFAGFFAACLVLTNIAFAGILPILTVTILAGLPWGGGRFWPTVRRLAVIGAIGAASFATTLILADIWYRSITGIHLWQPNLHFIREFRNDETFAVQTQRSALRKWFPETSWLIWPAIVTAAGTCVLIGRAGRRETWATGANRGLAWLALVQAGLLAGTVAGLSQKLYMFGVLWFYGVVLYQPMTILLAAGLLDRVLPVSRPSPARWLPPAVLLVAGLVAVHGAALLPAVPPEYDPAVFGLTFLAGVAGFGLTMAGSARRATGLTLIGMAILGTVQGPMRAMFRVDAGRAPSLVKFAMLDRCRALDESARVESAQAVRDAVERCLALSPANDLGFWYDQSSPMAPAFEMIHAAFAYGRILSKDMDDIQARPLGGMQVGLEPGRMVVVLTDDVAGARAAAYREFDRLGVGTRELGHDKIANGPVRFALLAWEIESAPEELAGSLGRVRLTPGREGDVRR